jgi:hypothetical protein
MIDANFIQVELSPNETLRSLQLRTEFHRCKEFLCGIERSCPAFNRHQPYESYLAMQNWALAQTNNIRQCNEGFPRRYNPNPTYFDAKKESFSYHNTSHLARWTVPHVPLWLISTGSHQCIKYLPDDSLIPSIITQLECSYSHAEGIIKVSL